MSKTDNGKFTASSIVVYVIDLAIPAGQLVPLTPYIYIVYPRAPSCSLRLLYTVKETQPGRYQLERATPVNAADLTVYPASRPA